MKSRSTPSKQVARTCRCAGRRWKYAMPAGESRRRIGAPPASRRLQRFTEVDAGDLAHLGERAADERLGRVVEVDEYPARIEQEHRCRQIRRQLASEDQRQALRRGSDAGHGRNVTDTGGTMAMARAVSAAPEYRSPPTGRRGGGCADRGVARPAVATTAVHHRDHRHRRRVRDDADPDRVVERLRSGSGRHGQGHERGRVDDPVGRGRPVPRRVAVPGDGRGGRRAAATASPRPRRSCSRARRCAKATCPRTSTSSARRPAGPGMPTHLRRAGTEGRRRGRGEQQTVEGHRRPGRARRGHAEGRRHRERLHRARRGRRTCSSRPKARRR